MKKLQAMTLCELKTFIREPMGASFIIFFPLIMFISTLILQGQKVLSSTLPGNLGMTITAAGLLGVTINLAVNRENRVLKRFQTTSVSALLIIISDFIVLCIFSLAGIVLQVLLAFLISPKDLMINLTLFTIDLLIASVYFFSLAFFISSYIKNVKSIHAITSSLFTIMLIFSGTTFPLNSMPLFTRCVSIILPLTQVNLLFRNDLLAIPYQYRWISYLYIVISSLLFLIIGKRTFKWE